MMIIWLCLLSFKFLFSMMSLYFKMLIFIVEKVTLPLMNRLISYSVSLLDGRFDGALNTCTDWIRSSVRQFMSCSADSRSFLCQKFLQAIPSKLVAALNPRCNTEKYGSPSKVKDNTSQCPKQSIPLKNRQFLGQNYLQAIVSKFVASLNRRFNTEKYVRSSKDEDKTSHSQQQDVSLVKNRNIKLPALPHLRSDEREYLIGFITRNYATEKQPSPHIVTQSSGVITIYTNIHPLPRQFYLPSLIQEYNRRKSQGIQ